MFDDPSGKLTIIKGVNPMTGKESKDTDFSSALVSGRTVQCTKSAKNLGAKKLDLILECAFDSTTGASCAASVQSLADDNFDFALLVDED